MQIVTNLKTSQIDGFIIILCSFFLTDIREYVGNIKEYINGSNKVDQVNVTCLTNDIYVMLLKNLYLVGLSSVDTENYAIFTCGLLSDVFWNKWSPDSLLWYIIYYADSHTHTKIRQHTNLRRSNKNCMYIYVLSVSVNMMM